MGVVMYVFSCTNESESLWCVGSLAWVAERNVFILFGILAIRGGKLYMLKWRCLVCVSLCSPPTHLETKNICSGEYWYVTCMICMLTDCPHNACEEYY